VRPGEAVWCYTALVIDAFAGYLVAWECSRSKQTAFVESAIRHHLCTASAGAHQPKPKPTTTHDRPANPPIHTN
jgi:putative transposase